MKASTGLAGRDGMQRLARTDDRNVKLSITYVDNLECKLAYSLQRDVGVQLDGAAYRAVRSTPVRGIVKHLTATRVAIFEATDLCE